MKWMYPIALDLGAKNTGVYNLSYKANTTINDFENTNKVTKSAFVAHVPEQQKGGYTLLQTGRTATRHAIRCRKRNKQAKKLFLLLLERVYNFKTQGHEAAISHFLNRRGYNYHESQIDFTPLTDLSQEELLAVESLLVELNASQAIVNLDFDEIQISLTQLEIADLEELQQHLESVEKAPKSSPIAVLLKITKELKKEKIKEQTSGAKHRRDYFAAIHADITAMASNKEKQFKKLFNALNHAKGFKQGRFLEVFWRTLCHVNNLDLKVLNRIHKDINQSTSAASIDGVLAKHIGHWVLKLWSGKDANTAERKNFNQKLKTHLAAHPANILGFLQQTHPEHTIAPYESHTNRKPPYCQTLLLNARTLNTQYADWQLWLDLLVKSNTQVQAIVSEYQQVLRSKKSSGGNVLVELDKLPNNKPNTPKRNGELELEARSLQFIFDATAKTCPYKLSEIWGKLKQIKQLQRNNKNTIKAEQALSDLLKESQLPTEIKTQCSHHANEKSFWHLVNSYYQARRRAKQGRYFIHRDNRANSELSKWQNEGKLLQVCRHKPRQLNHQALDDVLNLLSIKKSDVAARSDAELDISLTSFNEIVRNAAKGIVSLAAKAHKAQKDYGIDLKAAIATELALQKLSKSAEQKARLLAEFFFDEQQQQDYFFERNKSIFIFAQLHSLLFKVERSGFAKTCPVCSADNGARMQIQNGSAQASRLSTMSLRLIDGGLKRLLNHQAHHIANRLWPEIKNRLKHGDKITIPLILEQNRFDFSSHLHTLKGQGKNKQQRMPNDQAIFMQKKERIFNAGQHICPYTGELLTLEQQDIDHIIPRSGIYGVLNDEANLIAASLEGNRRIKQNRVLTLTNLHKDYLTAIFKTSDPQKIKNQIYQTLWCKQKAQFVFGQYHQFVALTQQQQVAFRHALFLASDDELRSAVVNAIQHSSKSRVNGSQRFMAQLLADALWKKAKEMYCENQLHFDYFEYSANSQDEVSTTSLRRVLTDSFANTDWDLTPYNKQKDQSQLPYSHVIDAMCAMALAIEQHQGEGALQVDTKSTSIWPKIDEKTGEYTGSNFELVAVKASQLAGEVAVKPKNLVSKIKLQGEHSKPHQVISRRVFGENALGIKFYDLSIENNQIVKGYYYEKGGLPAFERATKKVVDKTTNTLNWLVSNGYYRAKKKLHIEFFSPNQSAILSLMFSILKKAKQTKLDKNTDEYKAVQWLFGNTDGQLFYYTSKSTLENAPSIIEKLKSKNPLMEKWKKFYAHWQEVNGGKAPINQGQFIIEPENISNWQECCERFLNWNKIQEKHTAKRNYSMFNETVARGNVAMQFKHGKFTLYPVNNNDVPKAQSMHFLLNSPSLVAFESSILTKGYIVDLTEKAELKNSKISVKTLFKEEKSNQLSLSLDNLLVDIPSNTQINISGINQKWFEQHLLVKQDEDQEAWKKRASLAFDKYDAKKCAVNTATLKSLVNTSFRAERGKTLKVKHIGDTLTIGLPVKAEHITKLLAKQNSEG